MTYDEHNKKYLESSKYLMNAINIRDPELIDYYIDECNFHLERMRQLNEVERNAIKSKSKSS